MVGESGGLFRIILLLWMLSLLSKEMAASLPILIFVWHFCDSWMRGPDRSGDACGKRLENHQPGQVVVDSAFYRWNCLHGLLGFS